MTKTEKELKKEFSAYVKTAIKNTQKQYLIKKGKILDNEIAMDDEGIDEILQKQTEDLFDKMDLNVDMVLSDEINVNSFLDQINDPVLYVSLCSLKELQQKVLMLRIVYVKSFDDIAVLYPAAVRVPICLFGRYDSGDCENFRTFDR